MPSNRLCESKRIDAVMEIPAYTQDHLKFRKRVRRFMEKEVLPNIDQWEAERLVPKTVWKKMGERGFLCTCLMCIKNRHENR